MKRNLPGKTIRILCALLCVLGVSAGCVKAPSPSSLPQSAAASSEAAPSATWDLVIEDSFTYPIESGYGVNYICTVKLAASHVGPDRYGTYVGTVEMNYTVDMGAVRDYINNLGALMKAVASSFLDVNGSGSAEAVTFSLKRYSETGYRRFCEQSCADVAGMICPVDAAAMATGERIEYTRADFGEKLNLSLLSSVGFTQSQIDGYGAIQDGLPYIGKSTADAQPYSIVVYGDEQAVLRIHSTVSSGYDCTFDGTLSQR